MGVFSWFRRKPSEVRQVSPTVSAYVYAPGQYTNGFFRKGGASFEQIAAEGYGKNVIAYVAVDEVAKAVASVPWLCYRKTARAEERTELPLPPVVVRPNPYQSWASFIYGLVSYHRISGNAFVEAIAPTIFTPPTGLYLHRPDKIRPIPGRLGLSAYGYVTNEGVKPLWPVDAVTQLSNMRHFHTFHPTEPWWGLSPIEAAALPIDVHNDANLWNANLLRRGASTDLAIVSEKPMSEKSYTRLRDQLQEDAQGAQNVKGFTLIDDLGDKYHFEKISFSPRDMAWMEAKNTSAHEIAIAVGGSTMPFLLGLPGLSTYNNQQEARLAFWDTFILPLLIAIRDQMNVWLMPRFGPELELDVDLDKVPALEPRRIEMWKRTEESTVLSLNEKRALLGFDEVTDPGADIPTALLQYTMAQQAREDAAEEDTATPARNGSRAARFARSLTASGMDGDLAHALAHAAYPHSQNGTVH